MVKNFFIQGAISADFISREIAKHYTKKTIGAHSIFLGQVREDIINSKFVKAIEYSTYEAMAFEQMNILRDDIFNKYELSCMHIFHSLGLVNAGDISLFVFVSSKHRRIAFDACEEVVELVKSKLPIWGKEIFHDNSYNWKVNH